MTWRTPDNLALIAHLAGENKSAQFIAWQIGTTRNAILGYCVTNNIQLKGKRGGDRSQHAKKEPTKTKSVWRMKPKASDRKPPLEDPTLRDPKWTCQNPVSLMDALPHHCRWPAGGQRCCGQRITYQSYCGAHADVAFLGRHS